jgi:hypothetical protein
MSVSGESQSYLPPPAKTPLKLYHNPRSPTRLVRDWFLDSSKSARFIVRHGVTFESHALMQNPYDQHTVLIAQKENHMGLEIHPPESGGQVPGASPAVWIFRESAEYLFQPVPVASRLFDAELPDSVAGNPGDVGISPF